MITPAQCRAARGLLDWPQRKLASAAAIAPGVLSGFERGRGRPAESVLSAIRDALEAAGVVVVAETDDDGAGVRLRKDFDPELRQRASMGKPAASRAADGPVTFDAVNTGGDDWVLKPQPAAEESKRKAKLKQQLQARLLALQGERDQAKAEVDRLNHLAFINVPDLIEGERTDSSLAEIEAERQKADMHLEAAERRLQVHLEEMSMEGVSA